MTMLKLMKYETRKTFFSKIVLLTALGLSELLFLYGLYFTDTTNDPVIAYGIAALVLCTVIGLSFIGIESILTLHKDLNTKQSYMLFMTPRSGYQILGAKILENALTILATSGAFLALAGVDISLMVAKVGGLTKVFEMVQQILNVHIEWNEVSQMAILSFLAVVISWFSMIVTGYLAVILVASVLAGKRFSGLLSFILFILLTWGRSWILNRISVSIDQSIVNVTGFLVYLAISVVISVVLYLISCFMIEKKLSV